MTAEDEEHLRLLSIFHYVAAGLGGLCSLFPVIHLLVGLSILRGEFFPRGGREPEFGTAVGGMFVAVACLLILGGLAVSACIAWAGRCLAARRHRTFCLVTAGLACLWMPVGTVLGVFTLIVLSREGVKAAFDAPPA